MSSLPAKSAVAVDAVLFVVIIVGSLLLFSIPCSRRFSFSIHLEAADDDEDDDDSDDDDDEEEIKYDDLRYKANGALN